MNKHSDFVISATDGRPMYLQIMEQIRHKVALGDWAPGDPVPSIRQLASTLCISVITIKRAYLELEREGIIVTQQGRGSCVSARPNVRAGLWEKQMQQHLEQAVQLGRLLGYSGDDMATRVRAAMRHHARQPLPKDENE